MPININGTTGISGADGSAATPAIQGADTNTGIFFPASDTVAIATGGVERVRTDASGNVGIGTSSPTAKVQIGDATVVASNRIVFGKAQSSTEGFLPAIGHQSAGVGNDLAFAATSTSGVLRFFTGASSNSGEIGTGSNAERARIDSSGNLLVNRTSQQFQEQFGLSFDGSAKQGAYFADSSAAATATMIGFYKSGGARGSITTTSTATAYGTSSDYRLKHDIQPMTGALERISALKPVTYKWNIDGSEGSGFIAHELQAVKPQAVIGDKDAVDVDGNPVYQSIDTSFLVADLTAAIQELKAIVDAQAVEIAALKGAA